VVVRRALHSNRSPAIKLNIREKKLQLNSEGGTPCWVTSLGSVGSLLVAVVVTRDLVTRYHGTGPAVTRCLWRYSLPTRYSVTGVTAKWCEAVGSGLGPPRSDELVQPLR